MSDKICEPCEGSGRIWDLGGNRRCSDCGGTGKADDDLAAQTRPNPARFYIIDWDGESYVGDRESPDLVAMPAETIAALLNAHVPAPHVADERAAIKCGICGRCWADHDATCFRHAYRPGQEAPTP